MKIIFTTNLNLNVFTPVPTNDGIGFIGALASALFVTMSVPQPKKARSSDSYRNHP